MIRLLLIAGTVLAVLACVYAGAYVGLSEPLDGAPNLRVYRLKWEATLFTPAAKIESLWCESPKRTTWRAAIGYGSRIVRKEFSGLDWPTVPGAHPLQGESGMMLWGRYREQDDL